MWRNFSGDAPARPKEVALYGLVQGCSSQGHSLSVMDLAVHCQGVPVPDASILCEQDAPRHKRQLGLQNSMQGWQFGGLSACKDQITIKGFDDLRKGSK